MTATEELRRLLDERGVEHCDGTETTLWLKDDMGYRARADEGLQGFIYLHLWCTTPEQAIAATLGSGTCKWEPADFITEGEWWNTSCGESFTWEPDGTPRYCPNCGARVVGK